MSIPDEFSRRFDTQDETLKKILEGMAEHRKYHEMTDPALTEVIDVLKGAKAIKTFASWIVGLAIVASGAWAWLGDHVRFK